jgi:hypothetical protein
MVLLLLGSKDAQAVDVGWTEFPDELPPNLRCLFNAEYGSAAAHRGADDHDE